MMCSMTTDTGTVRLHEQHTASANIELTSDLTLIGKQNVYSRKQYNFRPGTLYLTWNWSSEDDIWQLVSMRAVGPNIKVNGELGDLRPSRSFVNKDGEIVVDTPQEFIDLAFQYEPVSKVTGEIR